MEKIIKFLFSGTVSFEDLSLAQLLDLSHVSKMMLLDKFKDKLDDICEDNVLCGRRDIHFLCEIIQGLKLADIYKLSIAHCHVSS